MDNTTSSLIAALMREKYGEISQGAFSPAYREGYNDAIEMCVRTIRNQLPPTEANPAQLPKSDVSGSDINVVSKPDTLNLKPCPICGRRHVR